MPLSTLNHYIAALIYALATQLNAANNSLLWHAVLGLTDQYTHERIDQARYQADYKHIRTAVLDYNPSNDERVRRIPFLPY